MFIGLLGTMLLITGTIGLQWGAVFIAFAGPPAMMQNKTGWIGGVIAGVAILVLNFLFFDYLLAVFWPDPFILDWFRARF